MSADARPVAIVTGSSRGIDRGEAMALAGGGRAGVAVVGDALPFTTGQRIDVDGGFPIRRL